MNSREERRARRQEEKAARESYEQLCGEIEAELRRGREAKELRERRAAACERTGFDLRRPGEDLKTGDKAQDTIAEAESIVI